jgi:Kef-type K+ transport system membrane component KefB
VNSIEAIIVLLLLFMGVPDLCRKFGRPALSYPGFILFGLLIGPLVDTSVAQMLRQAGHVGFLLLLFEVGLEIDLPRLKQFVPALRFAVLWSVLLIPLALLLALHAGFELAPACMAATALTGCSVGMAHSGWKAFPMHPASTKSFVLQVMVALEMLAIVAMAVCGTTLHSGMSPWVLVRLAGIAVAVMLIARFADHLAALFQSVIARTTQWRVHWLTLLILVTCALGHRLGLDAAKTAFFLGLALSRARHNGMDLQSHMAPVSHRFLIPLFFVSLGLQIEWAFLMNHSALLAVGAAGLLLGAREIIHRRWLPTGAPGSAFLLLSPNLTLAALAANTLLAYGTAAETVNWLLVSGLAMTVPAIVLLPAPAARNRPPAPALAPSASEVAASPPAAEGETPFPRISRSLTDIPEPGKPALSL